MTGKELKEKFENISDNDDVFFDFKCSDGNKYSMKIESANAERFMKLKDAVFILKEYCFSRQAYMYSCRNCPFNREGNCIISDLRNVDSNNLPDATIILRREK